jgi:hypothetical protein
LPVPLAGTGNLKTRIYWMALFPNQFRLENSAYRSIMPQALKRILHPGASSVQKRAMFIVAGCGA